MMPRTGSYGETPTVTRSPGTTLIRKRRIRPRSWASTSWPASHCTRYNPPLCTATTVPCMSIRSSLLKLLAVLSVRQILCHILADLLNVNGDGWGDGWGTGYLSQCANGLLDLARQGFVILACQSQGRSEFHANATRTGHPPAWMEHGVETDEAHGND